MSIRLSILLSCVAAFTGAAGSVSAQQVDESRSWTALRRGDAVYLSLDDAIRLALQNNLDVELQRSSQEIAEADLLRTRAGGSLRGILSGVREGPRSLSRTTAEPATPASSVGLAPESSLSITAGTNYNSGPLPRSLDPLLVGSFRRQHQTLPQTNSFAVGASLLRSDATSATIGVQKGFLSGGELILSFDTTEQSLNNRRYDLNPFSSGSFGVSFTQPLLRGFGPTLNSRFIRIARNNRQVADLVFQQQVISTVAAVVRLYWDLAGLIEDVNLRRQALERSERLLGDTEAQVEAGTLATVDAVRARAEVARSRRDLISSEALVRQQETSLKDYLSRQTVDSPELAGIRVVLTDALQVDTSEAFPTLQQIADRALRERPDLVQARLQIENGRIALEGSRNGLLPSLDVVAFLKGNGLTGEVNPLTIEGGAPHNPDPVLVGGYGDLLSQIGRGAFRDYGVGMQLTIPLGNRVAESDLARDRLVLRQQEIRLQLLDKQLRVEIQNALIALKRAKATLAATEREREFQETALAAEEEKLAVGASTVYLVIQYQRDLAEARAAEVAAMAEYLKARSALDRASGNLLPRHRVQIDGKP